MRGFLGLDWPYILFTRSPHIYFIVVYVFRSTDNVSLSLIPLVHVVDQEETEWRRAPIMSVLTPPLGHGGRLRFMWGLHVSLSHGGGVGAHWGPPVLSSMTSERIQRSGKGGEAGLDPRGHLWVTWGLYLWAGKPPLADIILSHPPDLT